MKDRTRLSLAIILHLVYSRYRSWANTAKTIWCFALCSYVYEVETGLYYLQSRYYNPQMGRFLNADIYAATGQGFIGNNMFAYCGNNPVILRDPSGKLFISALIVIGSALLVGAGTGALMATCDGGSTEEIIEGAIEGALTGAAAATIGLLATPVAIAGVTIPSAVVAGVGGMAAGAVIDAGVQTTSHLIREGSLENFKLDKRRMFETSLSTGISAMVPAFEGTPTDTSMAIGTAIVSAEASTLIASGFIIAKKIIKVKTPDGSYFITK